MVNKFYIYIIYFSPGMYTGIVGLNFLFQRATRQVIKILVNNILLHASAFLFETFALRFRILIVNYCHKGITIEIETRICWTVTGRRSKLSYSYKRGDEVQRTVINGANDLSKDKKWKTPRGRFHFDFVYGPLLYFLSLSEVKVTYTR